METITTDLTDEIKNLNAKFTSAFNQGDTANIANLYTMTALLLPAGSDFVKGNEGIGEYWQAAREQGVKEMVLDTIEVEQLEITAIELGTYSFKGQDGQILDKGKYMAVWKRDNGQWKMQKDIWNSNQEQA